MAMIEGVKQIERALITLLEARGCDVGMDPNFILQANAIGGRYLLNRRSVSDLPYRQASGVGLWSPDDVNGEIAGALKQIGNGVERLSKLEPEIYKLMKLSPESLIVLSNFVSETREQSKLVSDVISSGVNPKHLGNVDLVVLMEAALNGAIGVHKDCGIEKIKIPRKLTGRPWINYYESISLIMGVPFDNYERSYETMLKSRRAIAKARQFVRLKD